MEENNINNVNDSIEDNAKTDKKKISPAKLIVPIIIVVILAVFAGRRLLNQRVILIRKSAIIRKNT